MSKFTEKSKIELLCREAQLILNVIPLRKNMSEMKEEEIASIRHYVYCNDCRDRGLADILDTKFSCKEAILVWAERAGALWLDCSSVFGPRIKTLIELYAAEHVWGKYQWKNSRGGFGWEIGGAGCRERSCLNLHSYWARVPIGNSAGDGPGGVIYLFPFLFEIFLKEKWPLEELLAIQKNRIAAVLKDIESGKITVSRGHYNSIDELIEEMREHVVALQKLAVRPTAQVVPA